MCINPAFAADSLVPVGPGWKEVAVDRRVGRVPACPDRIDQAEARFCLVGGGGLHVQRVDRRAVLTSPEPMSDDELLHPYLAPIGAAFAWWSGHEALHAGAVILGGRAWAIVGEKGAGKSTLLAALALTKHAIVTDDMLVIAEGMALAGPRCVDLRESAARHLGVGRHTLRPPEPRWRLDLQPVPAASPVAGWIFLSWGDDSEVTPIAASELLPRLAANRSMHVEPRNPAELLDLATLPAWEVRRPAHWAGLFPVIDLILDLAASA